MWGISGGAEIDGPSRRVVSLLRMGRRVPTPPTGLAVSRDCPPLLRRESTAMSARLKPLAELTQVLLETRVLAAELGDLLVGMENGGVILAAEGLADRGEG
jgi:hypothetical protein